MKRQRGPACGETGAQTAAPFACMDGLGVGGRDRPTRALKNDGPHRVTNRNGPKGEGWGMGQGPMSTVVRPVPGEASTSLIKQLNDPTFATVIASRRKKGGKCL